jgi:hypothetical protein
MLSSRLVSLGLFAILATSVSSVSADNSNLVVYPPVPGLPPSDQYAVRVRAETNGSAWQPVFAWVTTCGTNSTTDAYFTTLSNWTHTYANFVANIPLVVEIAKLDGGVITNAAVHPARKGTVTISGGKAYVTLTNNCSVAVDINGQMDENDTGLVVTGSSAFFGHAWQGPPIHTISIHNHPPLTNVPATNDPSVQLVIPGTPPPATGSWTTLYFLPGIHNIGIGFPIHADRSYYIPGDALVCGSFYNDKVWSDGHDIRIFGHGTLSQTGWPNPTRAGIDPTNHNMYRPIDIAGAMRSRVEGITIADPCNHSVMMAAGNDPAEFTSSSWVKVFGWRANGDGINPFGNGRIEHCFLRTQDDGCYVNGVGISDTVFWNDANGSAFVLSSLPQLTNRTLLVRDCDVIYARAKWIYWGGGRVFNMRGEGSGNCGAGVVFSNINIEDPRPTMQSFFGCMTVPAPYGSDSRGAGDWSGTVFRNVRIATTNRNSEPEMLWGAPGAQIHDLTFDNLTVGGIEIRSNIFLTNSNVYNLCFTNSSLTRLCLSEARMENDRITFSVTNPGGYVGLSGSNGASIFAVTNNGRYIVQATSNPAAPDSWSALLTNTAPFTFTETNPFPTHPYGFYRVKRP